MATLEGGVWKSDHPGVPALVQLEQALAPLPVTRSVMNIGAHPDDERSGDLAYWSRGLGARVISVIATRGEGGQNQLGPELYDALGVIRTRELERAAAITGVIVDFLSRGDGDVIYDFGFSKTSRKAFLLWGERNLLAREVEMIRRYRPDILVSSHNDKDDEQGQHRALAVTIPRAVAAAADPESFPEQLAAGLLPWRVRKVYFPASERDATVVIPVGEFDATTGLSYKQLGELSRSWHKSQGMGRPCPAGPAFSYLAQAAGPGAVREESVFDGLPLTFTDHIRGLLPGESGVRALAEILAELDETLRWAVKAFPDRERVARGVHAALALVRRAREAAPTAPLEDTLRHDLAFRLAIKEQQLTVAGVRALLLVAAVSLEAVTVMPGNKVRATVSVFNGGRVSVPAVYLGLQTPPGWKVEACDAKSAGAESPAASEGKTAGYNEEVRACFVVEAPGEPSYYRPYQPPVVTGTVSYELDGVRSEFSVAPQRPDPALLPPFGLALSSAQRLLKPGAGETREVKVALTSFAADEIAGHVRLEVPAGWTSWPETQAFRLTSRNAVTVAGFKVTTPPTAAAKPGRRPFSAVGWLDGEKASRAYVDHVSAISYPHIGKEYFLKEAKDFFAVVDYEIPPALRVGWVDGGFDKAYSAVADMGVAVDLLGPEEIGSDDLSKYDAVVIGIRAYLSRSELSAHNGRLLEYVNQGGFLLVNYHKPTDDLGENPPYEILPGSPSIRWRVSDENAPVEITRPEHPFFNWPNKITPDDWNGWVQERGLYFAMKWAPEYEPLVSIAEPGETALRGALLFAHFGAGAYAYTGLAWHRQLQALVPGAVRLFANILSYRKWSSSAISNSNLKRWM